MARFYNFQTTVQPALETSQTRFKHGKLGCFVRHTILASLVVMGVTVICTASAYATSNQSPLVATLPGDFTVSPTGAAQYSIPIEIPEGTAGVQPQLSLNYNSQSGPGLLGLGWSIGGLSSITRCPTTLAQDGFIDGVDFDENDRFCLDGQRLIVVEGDYGADGAEYRTEIDGFSRIRSFDTDGIHGPDYFTVETKAGETMEYGRSEDSSFNPPLANGETHAAVLSWSLNKVSDTLGNYFTLEYLEDETTGEHVIEKIRYTGNEAANLAPYLEIRFEYQPNANTRFVHVSNRKIVNWKRIYRIDITYDDNSDSGYTAVNKLMSYKFKYSDSRINQLIEIHKCDANDQCVLPTQFEYKDSKLGWNEDVNYEPPVPIVREYKNNLSDYGVRFVDVNGDGRQDLVHALYFDGKFSRRETYLNKENGWELSEAYKSPVDIVTRAHDAHHDYGVRFIDINGDGLVDILSRKASRHGHNDRWGDTYLNTGSGWEINKDYQSPVAIVRHSNHRGWFDYGARLVDLNGDGLVDILQGIRFDSSSTREAYLNTGSGWEKSDEYKPPVDFVRAKDGYQDYGARLVDLNGDGLLDIVQGDYESGSSRKRAYLNTGSGWRKHAGLAPPKFFVRYTQGAFQDRGVRLVDLNGDGLQDMLWAIENKYDYDQYNINTKAYINTGERWIESEDFQSPVAFIKQYQGKRYDDYGTRLIDINGDGLKDLVQGVDWRNSNRQNLNNVFINNGQGWSRDESIEAPMFAVLFDNKIQDNGVREIDINGDGLSDIIRGRSWTNNIYEAHKSQQVGKPYILTKVTNGFGVAINIDYQPLTDPAVYTKGTDAQFPQQDVQMPMYVVSETRTDNAVGTYNTLQYHYQGAKVDMQGRGFLGFAQHTVYDPDTDRTISTQYQQDFPYTGLVQEMVTQQAGVTLSKESNTHSQVISATSSEDTSVASVFIYSSSSQAQSYDVDSGDLLTTTTTSSDYDDYGNPTRISVTTQDVGLPSYTTTITENSYGNYISPTKWHLGRLTQAHVTKYYNGDNNTRTSAYAYDATTGLLTEEIIEPDTEYELRTTYDYDNFGNRTSVTTRGSHFASIMDGTNISARTTLTRYDSQGRFMVSITNPLGHSETREYDHAWGKLTQLTGPNGLSTRWRYDSLGRVMNETRADGNRTTTSYTLCQDDCPPLASGQSLVYYKTVHTDGAPSSWQYYDAVNRVVLTETENFHGQRILVQTEYDHRARVARTSSPYIRGEIPSYWSENSYDVHDRLIQTISPSGEVTQYEYAGFETTVINALEQTHTEKTNSRGHTLWTQDNLGERITFSYDAAGNLITTEHGDSITTNTYDRRGKRIRMNDPNMGEWTYRYNVLGELISQTDAKGQTTTMQYDVLGRMTQRVSSEGVSTWEYDSQIYGIGKLAQETGPDGFERGFVYDEYGRVIETTQSHNGLSFSQSVSYDQYGRVQQKTNPNGFVVNHNYNQNGYLLAVTTPAAQMENYDWSSLQETLENSLQSAYDYQQKAQQEQAKALQYREAAKRYQRLAAIHSWHGNTSILNQLRESATSLENYAKIFQDRADYYQSRADMYFYYAEKYTQYALKYPHHSIYSRVAKIYSYYAWRYENVAYNNRLIAEESLQQAQNTNGINLQSASLTEIVDYYTEQTEKSLALAQEAEQKMAQYQQLAEAAKNGTENTQHYQALLASGENNEVTLWRAVEYNVNGQLIKSINGNGLITEHTIDLASGELRGIRTALNNQKLRDLSYQYNAIGHLVERRDNRLGVSETFDYDQLNRLTRSQVIGHHGQNNHSPSLPVTLSYDHIGNIVHKSDVGDYHYDPAHPQRLMRIGDGEDYFYDANGNISRGDGKRYQWSSFNKPIRLSDEHQLVEFKYDVNRQRYHKQTTRAGMTTETHYVGKSYERLSVNHNVQHKHYIYAGGALVAIHTEHDTGSVETNTTRYVHKDHLGSTDALSNEQGEIVERMSYDAWGQRRSSDWQADDTPQPGTNRGYTGHEHIDELGIIHMNGRVYDPKIARFLSADPFIPDVNNLQSHNRYAYVMNNPLNATDPSGFFFKKITNAFKKVAKSVSSAVSGALQNRWVRMGIAMYGAYLTGGMAYQSFMKGAINSLGFAGITSGTVAAASMTAGAVGGFTGAMIMSGGDIRAGVLGGMTGGAAGFIGASSAFGAVGTTTTGRVVAHGTVGGVSSELSGGNFKDGFVSSAFTKTVSSPLSDMTHNNPVAGSIASSVVGGTASVLSGGKFHNAALTSGFQYMFNEAMSGAQQRQGTEQRGRFVGVRDGLISLATDVKRFFRFTGRSVGLYGSEEAQRARQEGLFVDEVVGGCASSSACRAGVETATKEFIRQNDSPYFRARVGTRAIVGGITGTGPAGVHGAVDHAVENGAKTVEEFIPGIIYGTD